MIEQGIDGYLPVSWLSKHNPDIDWDQGTLRWRSQYCKERCLPRQREIVIEEVDWETIKDDLVAPDTLKVASIEYLDDEKSTIRQALPKQYWP